VSMLVGAIQVLMSGVDHSMSGFDVSTRSRYGSKCPCQVLDSIQVLMPGVDHSIQVSIQVGFDTSVDVDA
jgi:hypothetical protein